MASVSNLLDFFLPYCSVSEPTTNNEEFVVERPKEPYDIAALKPYTYTSLGGDAYTIRVLTLHQSPDFSAVPEVTIHTTILSASETQKYEALSYTWGSPADSEEIVVWQSPSELQKGAPAQPEKIWRLSVTKNLYEAL